ncbi:DUF3471 domain-containing protein [Telluribacter sp.]|jgi:hypothetical protein|uniref:DUF3471 domain-containing protein n=1 Tax=Telluribacter sp. TaxID=1978767 RepID=UPI002E0E6042|nr:DUF3471 domain-containing protein [Telluribacter sp.]
MKKLTLLLLLIWSAAQSQSVTTNNNSAPHKVEDYAGTYQFKDNEYLTNFVVKVTDGALYGEADGNGANKLLPQDQPDVFKSTSQYGSIITFRRDPTSKKVTGLVLRIMDTDMVAERKE